jgi:hypothetical protein
MTLADLKTATRILIRDRIVSPATEGRLILETELLSISNSSIREILPMLVSAGVAEML